MNNLCLVTGACGFSGSYMVELLKDAGYKVRATDLLGTDRGIYKEIIEKENVEFIPSDLTKKETLKEVVKDIEYIFHPAAIFSYSASYEVMEKVNVFGTRNLCSVLLEEGKVKRLVVWSTIGVYGFQNPENFPIKEEHLPNPSNLYEKSKYEQEKVVMEFYKKYNLPVTIIRPAPIYGPRNIYGLAQIFKFYSKLPVIGMPKNMKLGMPFIHVKDACNSALFLSKKEEAIGQVYNMLDDSNIDSFEFFKYFAEILGKKFITFPNTNFKIMSGVAKIITFIFKILSKIIKNKTIIYIRETAPYITANYSFSNEKLKSLGYEFIYPTIKDGLPETINWYKEKGIIKG